MPRSPRSPPASSEARPSPRGGRNRAESAPQTPHDALFKGTLGRVQHARSLLRAVLPPELSGLVRWSTLKKQPGSFVDETLREQHTDLLFSAQVGERPVFFYVLFEHQSTADRWMMLRLLRYMIRIWEEHLAKEPKATRLPAIVPVVLHHSETGWTYATAFEELIDLDDETRDEALPFVPRFRLLLDDVSHATDEELLARSMTALAKMVLGCFRHSRDMRNLLENLRPWANLLEEIRRSPSGVRAYAIILRYILGAADHTPEQLRALVAGAAPPEIEEEMASTADMLIEEGMQKGLLKGRQEGRRAGRADTVLKLLRLKFRRLPAGTAARVRDASEAELQRWTERVLTATSLADVLDD